MQQIYYIYIPAKAILFGEYAVLFNYPAIAISSFKYYFLIKITINKKILNKNIKISSKFFNNYLLLNIDELSIKTNDINYNFFASIFLPLKSILINFNLYNLDIEILQSFSPSLGFGSSSALIAGIYKFISVYCQFSFDDLWSQIIESLFLTQGGGSGYDIAIQFNKSLCDNNCNINLNTKTQFWEYKYNKQLKELPYLKEIFINDNKELGYIIPTNIYSSTKNVLTYFFNLQNKEYFAHKHGELSLSFLKNNSVNNIKLLMNKSRKIALTQNIIPNEIISLSWLKNSNWKTMGAGHGDSLWVITNDVVIQNKSILKI